MKKKGLIVATIVMVLVLAVSLTTATYAWFTSTAQATVENLTIKTTAASGVQIAVYDGTDTNTYYNGNIEYDGTKAAGAKWDGSNRGFGTLLDFANIEIGTMVNAVTNQATESELCYTEVKTPIEADLATYFEIDANGKPISAEGTTFDSNKTYYTEGECSTDADAFYRPTGYDANTQPYGYVVALPNTKAADASETSPGSWTSYYEIPLAMQAVKEANAILCSIKINAGEKATGDTLWPGMAAATKVRITPVVNGVEATTSFTFEPFKAYTYNAGTMTISNTTDSLANDVDGVLNFIVATGAITPADVYKLKIEIWVEGKDGECVTVLTNSTNFTVDFGFDIYTLEYTSGNIIVGEDDAAVTYEVVTGVTQTKTA